DWNNDNRTDLMVLNPRKQSGTSSVEDGTLYQFLDNASLTGKFPFSSISLTPSTAVWRQHVIAVDYNGDNLSDLVTTEANLDQLKLLLNSSGSFSDNGTISVGDIPVHLESIDFDNDTDSDLIVVNRGDNSISLLRNDSGSFSENATLSVGNTPLKTVSGDWDNDSDTDLAVLASADNNIEIWLNDGSGNFSKASTQPSSSGSSPRDLISGDWNCDGYLDLATADYLGNSISLFYGQSSGADFSSPQTISIGKGPASLASADFNNDGRMDFVIAHRFYYTTSSLSLLTGDIGILLSESVSNGQVVFTSETRLAATTESQGTPPADILIQDLDQDSKLDLLLSLPINQKLAVLSGKNYTGSLNCP
ncbi:MAG: FG-GAP repeat domain-containing protein, partial [bacterium]